jgi:uncharacterized protein YejL (UPF0352 family)
MSHDIILWVSISVMKIFNIAALETHKGPPYITLMGFSNFFEAALETHKGPPNITFVEIYSNLYFIHSIYPLTMLRDY